MQILDAAASLLARDGLQALTFEAVAHEAGLSRQLLRYYYSDMDLLVGDLCDHLAGQYQRLLISGIVDIRQVERLDFFLDFFFGMSSDHPMPVELETYDALIAYSVGSPLVRDRMCNQYHILGQVMIHELAIAHPELKGAACEELSFMFVSMMHAHWSFVASLGHSPDHNRLARNAFARLIRSYLDTPEVVPVMEKPWARRD
ncbi:TetR/AcrR family transcriptional regulator [Pseudooceanicola sp.]|uniref:TetR/AcrR family transcriptional regulator n=1 Tax=Pseudooceanicola sp. TaxID=1914328 RepID=UPI0035C72B0B